MDPVPPKQQAIGSFAFDDKEGCEQCLGPNHQVHVHAALGIRRISSKIVQNYARWRQIPGAHAKLPEGSVQHHVDRSSAINEHLGQWLAIDVSLQVQRPHVSIPGRFVEGGLLGQYQLRHQSPTLFIIIDI
jgi:hypothetical protein